MISAFPPEDAPNQRKMNMSAQNQELVFKLKGQLDSSYNKSISAASQKMSELNRGTKEVSQGFSDAEKSSRDFGSGSANAVSELESALAAAGIAVFLKETASASSVRNCGRQAYSCRSGKSRSSCGVSTRRQISTM